MGYVLSRDSFDQVLHNLSADYRIFAPVLKNGEGRFKDTDVVRYDFVNSLDEMELDIRSDYSFKDAVIPLSETMFFSQKIRSGNPAWIRGRS